MKTTILCLILLMNISVQALADCTVAYTQKISSDYISEEAAQRIEVSAREELTAQGLVLAPASEAVYLIDIHALNNMDHHNARRINAIAHLSLSTAVDKELFSYSMHFGNANRFGRRARAYSEFNFSLSIERALKSINGCEGLKKREAE